MIQARCSNVMMRDATLELYMLISIHDVVLQPHMGSKSGSGSHFTLCRHKKSYHPLEKDEGVFLQPCEETG
jgi:hypothetical protein